MADKKIIAIEIKVSGGNAKKATDETASAVENLSSKVTILNQKQREQIISDEKSAIQKRALIASLKAEAAAQMNVAAAASNAKATSGLNNAILLETSRLASDLSYGFSAIANNLGQLVNLFQIGAKNAGGFVAQFKQLGTSLLGSGGVLIAIQLLIAFGDDIYNFFFNSTKAADEFDKKMKELTSSIDDTLSKITNIRGDFLDFEKSNEDLSKTILILKNNFSSFQKGLDNLKEKGLDKNSDSLRKLIQDFFDLERVQKDIVIVLEELQRMDKKGLILTEDRRKLQIRLRDLLSEQMDLQEKFSKKDTVEKRIRQFERGFLDLAKLEEKYRQESIYQDNLTEEEKIKLKYDFQKEEAQILLNNFVFEQTIRLKRFLNESKDAEARKKAVQEYNESLIQAEKDYGDVLLEINNATNTQILQLEDSQSLKSLEIRNKMRDSILNSYKNILDSDAYYYQEKEIMLQQDIAMNEYALRDFTISTDKRAELELTLFNLRQQLRKNDLDQEISAIKEKERINLEYISFAQGISQIFKALAGENKGIQELALVLEKGAAIADIVIKTQAANASARAYDLALPPVVREASKAKTEIQIKRNNVSAGIAIANILSTTLTSFKKPSGSQGATGGANVQAPSFNTVGAAPESQLAQTVAMQQQKPIKAFVVGKEITNQQELERNILTTASFAG